MNNTIFIIALIAYLGLATVKLYRSPTHGWGFPMFILLYPVFLVAFFFATARFVAGIWFGLALTNMAVQYIYMKSVDVQEGLPGVLVASLFLWPVQFAAAINSSQTEKEERENKESNREKIGPLPATIEGTVSYAHHHGTAEGHDSVWLDEFGDLDFVTDAKTFDRIGIAEGKFVSLTIDERDAPSDLATGKVLWISDGKLTSTNV
ncbi:MAG: hypothetical protein ACR2Q3_08430 [Woeseiaceae bacterium]